jgi:hypothetical protein
MVRPAYGIIGAKPIEENPVVKARATPKQPVKTPQPNVTLSGAPPMVFDLKLRRDARPLK